MIDTLKTLPWPTLAVVYALAIAYCAVNYRKLFSGDYQRMLGFWRWLGFFVAIAVAIWMAFAVAGWIVELSTWLTFRTSSWFPTPLENRTLLSVYTLYVVVLATSAVITLTLGDRLYVRMLKAFSTRCQQLDVLYRTKAQQTFDRERYDDRNY